MQVPLTLQTIGDLDGGAGRAIIEAAIGEAIRDLDDRGEDGKPRKVEIVLTFTRRPNGQVECDLEAAPKGPRRRTASTVCNVRMDLVKQQAQLLFQTQAPSDPDQRTLDEME